MAQHDYNIANQSGADFRADLNNALSAIATVNSGASEPSTTFAHQLWVDTSNNVLKIRNAANSAFITTGISITADNTFAGALTGNVTGDLTGNADTATILATARTINGVSFNGSANISFGTDSVAEGSSNLYFTNERVDDRVDDLLVAGTGISLTYDDGSNTLTIANTNDADITGVVAGAALTGGGTSGDVTLNVAVDDSSIEINSDALRIKASGITNAMLAGSIANSKLSNSGVTINSQSLALGGSLDLDTSEIPESGNLYYTTARANTDFDTRLGTKSTSNLTEGSNLYYTDARVNSAFDTRLGTKDTDDVSEGTTNLYYTTSRTNTDFDTRLGTKSTSDLAEGTNLYYTSARFDSAFTSKDTDDLSEGTTNLYYTTTRFDSAFGNKTTADLTENTNLYYTDTRANSAIDARVTKAFVDALGIQANTVAANSVALGTDTTGNYIQTITGTANKITVSGSGSESADVTLSLPDDVQIADSLTVAGNLTVNGTLTSLDTTNLDIEDNLFQLNAGLTGSPVNDSGMLINRGTADNSIFMWDESVDKFTLGLTTADGSATGNITLSALGTLVANIEGSVIGNVTGTVSSLSNHDTADLTEGSNLYYTQARFDSAFTAKSTSDLSEGTNLYYTDVRFDTRLASKDTDDVSEGTSNLYYTSTRFDSAFGGKSTSDLTEGSNLYYTDARVQAISINNVVEDTTPQLGGDLDLNSSDITGTGDINITGTIQSSGNITGTLATAAQPNITSVGTLTGFTSTGIDDNSTSTAITIDSSENILVGKSATGGNTAGMQIIKGSFFSHVRDDGVVQVLNRKTSDGDILQFEKNNQPVGSIGTRDTGALEIGSGDVYLQFNGANDWIKPVDGSGSNKSGVDLGTTGAKFDNLYLSGTANVGGLTVDGNSTFNTSSTLFANLNYSGSNLGKFSTDGVNLNIEATNNLFLKVNSATRAKFDGNGDISFYEDTGTTAKFFWDASAESLGIGTTSPSVKLHTESGVARTSTAKTETAFFSSTDADDFRFGLAISHKGGTTDADRYASLESTAYRLSTDAFSAGGSLVLQELGGKVGIGISSPTETLHVMSGVSNDTVAIISGSQSDRGLTISTYSSDGRTDGGVDFDAYKSFKFTTDGTERARIDSSGNVGIGITPTEGKLHIKSDGSGEVELLTLENSTGTNGKTTLTFKTTSTDSTKSAQIFAERVNASGHTDLAFRTYNGSTTEAARIDHDGNVGITAAASLRFNGTGDNTHAVGYDSTVDGSFIRGQSGIRVLTGTGSGTERMRVNSTGVGIGTTSPTEKLTVNGALAITGALVDDRTSTGSMDYISGYTRFVSYGASGEAGAFTFNTAQGGSSSAQKVVISGSGNLLVGTTTFNNLSTESGILASNSVVMARGALNDHQDACGVLQYLNNATWLRAYGDTAGSGHMIFRTGGGGGSSDTERMRIDASGNLLINTTGAFDNGTSKLQVAGSPTGGRSPATFLSTGDAAPSISCWKTDTTTSSSARFIQFYANNDNTAMGGIVGNGASNVQFATLSDEREKENITSITNSLDKITSLNPVEFDWIASGEHCNAGFVAQEVETIFPEFVVENIANEGEEERKGLTGGMTGGIVAHLVKAIQEQQELINNLTSRIEELEN